MEERRKYVRLDTRLEVKYSVLEKGAQHKAISKDIGGGGVCLCLDEELESGTLLELKFTLPEDVKPTLAKGEVVWSDEIAMAAPKGGESVEKYFETGIKFIKIEPGDREKILKHIILGLASMDERKM